MVLKNIPNNKTYTVFAKALENYRGVMNLDSKVVYHSYTKESTSSGAFFTQLIYVGNRSSVKLTHDCDNTIRRGLEFSMWGPDLNDGKSKFFGTKISDGSTYNFVSGWASSFEYILLHGDDDGILGTFIKVEDTNTNEVLFEWRKS